MDGSGGFNTGCMFVIKTKRSFNTNLSTDVEYNDSGHPCLLRAGQLNLFSGTPERGHYLCMAIAVASTYHELEFGLYPSLSNP